MDRPILGLAGAGLFAMTCFPGCADDLTDCGDSPDDPVEKVICQRVSTSPTEARAAPPADLEAAPTLVTWETTLLRMPEGGLGWAGVDLRGVARPTTIVVAPPVAVELHVERPDGPAVSWMTVEVPCAAEALALAASSPGYLWLRLGPTEEREVTVAMYNELMSACE